MQNGDAKSVSWLPSTGQEADGRFDSHIFSRTVTLERAMLSSWQQLRLGVWEFIEQEFLGPWRYGLPVQANWGIHLIIRSDESVN